MGGSAKRPEIIYLGTVPSYLHVYCFGMGLGVYCFGMGLGGLGQA